MEANSTCPDSTCKFRNRVTGYCTYSGPCLISVGRERGEKWREIEDTSINEKIVRKMMEKVIKLEPFGWMFTPKMNDALTIEFDKTPIVICRNCKHYVRDDNGHVVVCRCELNHESARDTFFCADGEGANEEQEGR